MAYLDTIIRKRKGTEYEIRDTDAQNKITQITEDISELDSRLDGYENIFTGNVDTSVQNWLGAHPEATTTVKDGSITAAKLASGVIDPTLSISGAAAEAKATGDAVNGLRSALKASLNYIHVNSSGETSLQLNVGDTAIIKVNSMSGDGVNTYITGYTSTNVLLITQAGTYKYTAQNSGKLRFYFLGSGTTFDADIQLETAVGDQVAKIPDLEWASFQNLGVPLERGGYETGNGAPATKNARLRTPEYVDLAVSKLTFDTNYYAYIYAYTVDGTYVGVYTGSGYTTNWELQKKMYSPIDMSVFRNDGYRVKCVFIRSDSGTAQTNTLNLSAYTSMAKKDFVETYTVGENCDFSTFTDMLVSLKNNSNKKIVYVYGGVYDIFSEMGGAEFVQSIDTSQNWRIYNNIVPPNTTIIGAGDVTLAWNPTDEQIIDNAHATIFAPLNLSGTCKIQNIKIECSNCRYGIHDETSGRSAFNGVTHELDNVSVVYHVSTYGLKYAYGAGHNKNSKYKFKNCLFSAAFGEVWSMHDWPMAMNENSIFEFDNCVFINNQSNTAAGVRFSSSDTVGRLDDVKINGCMFSAVSFSTEGTTNIKQGYKVTTMLCKPYTVTYTSKILESDRIAPVDYLQLT